MNASADTLFTLGWELDSYKKLLVVHAELIATMESMVATLKTDKYPGGLRQLREQLKWYLKGVNTKKRETASHFLIFMISDKRRNKKP
ncbi:Hypp6802 [Branchiostoma lanceolatum]|uniref:Hypp6802 protein n=1 Tax=Branchiostoma lanceolatum TaxID=7740 RepID=A0A8J9YVK2_BRALA|nr:Hypp6802 [Branchiostoma lanceolatum]